MEQEIKIKMSHRIRSSSRLIMFNQKRNWNAGRVNLHSHQRSKKAISTYIVNHIADSLTFLRVVLALFLIGSVAIDGKANLAKDIWLLVVAWSTDMVDGRISRALKTNSQTWLGNNDVYVDMFLSFAVLSYISIAGLLPLSIVLIYLLIWGGLFLRWGVPPLFAQMFQNPIYACFVYLTVQAEPSILPWLFIWALIALVFFWRRLFELLHNGLNAIRG